MIAVLCAATNSIYHTLEDVDVYDSKRDARTFTGGVPVVTHPPCRAWSAYCAHQAKPEPGEKDLGLWCCEQLKRWGGVLEHPAHSRLFEAAGLPEPLSFQGDLWTAAVKQSWWGDSRTKSTWLCFSKVRPDDVEIPFVLGYPQHDRKVWNTMSKGKRAATPPSMAQWLVNIAKTAN